MPDILNEEMRRTATAKDPDKKTGRLALLFCKQCFCIKDARILDDRSVVAPNLRLTSPTNSRLLASSIRFAKPTDLRWKLRRVSIIGWSRSAARTTTRLPHTPTLQARSYAERYFKQPFKHIANMSDRTFDEDSYSAVQENLAAADV
jgi:hypothetical protein